MTAGEPAVLAAILFNVEFLKTKEFRRYKGTRVKVWKTHEVVVLGAQRGLGRVGAELEGGGHTLVSLKGVLDRGAARREGQDAQEGVPAQARWG